MSTQEQQALSIQALKEQPAMSSLENATSRRILSSDHFSALLGQPEVTAGAAYEPAPVLAFSPSINNRRKLLNSQSISLNNLTFDTLDLDANESSIHTTRRVARNPDSSSPLHGIREGSVSEPLLPSARSLDAAAAAQYEESLPTPAKLISEFDSLAGGYSHDSFARRQG